MGREKCGEDCGSVVGNLKIANYVVLMKIVIISRAIYPQLAPRPFRATELAKYFAKIGHDVTLYGVLGKFDYTNFEEETGVKVRNLAKMTFATQNSDGTGKVSLMNKVARKLLHRFLEFPDIELAFKVFRLLGREKDVDLLITVAIPYPIHWGAAWAKKRFKDRFPKRWISDCGDPYMGNSAHKKPLFYFQYVEDFWGRETDYITIPVEEARKAYNEKVQDKIRIIPQGFDFSNVKIDNGFKGNRIPHFAYAGVVYKDYRDPSRFLEYLSKIKRDFCFVVYTRTKELFENYQKNLGDKLVIKDYIPREELLFNLSRMDFLVNIQNNESVQAPSKLIDYYLSGRPILDISSAFTDEEQKNVDAFFVGDYTGKHEEVDIQQYNIENVGNAFLELS